MCMFYCSYDVVGVPKSPGGYIIGKVHLTPLASVTHLIPLLNVEVQQEFYSVVVGTMFISYTATTALYLRECGWPAQHVQRPVIFTMMVGQKHMDPVKNMSLYHCVIFFFSF
jgi:hypothetical protein